MTLVFIPWKIGPIGRQDLGWHPEASRELLGHGEVKLEDEAAVGLSPWSIGVLFQGCPFLEDVRDHDEVDLAFLGLPRNFDLAPLEEALHADDVQPIYCQVKVP